MAARKNKKFRVLLTFFILQISIVTMSLFIWGFIGKISASQFKFIVKVLPNSQKVVLSDSLNFYYNQGLAKYSRGLVLKCEPETESILNQFSWFHRNTLTYYFKDHPTYHDILVSAVDYFDILEDDKAQDLNSYRLESKLLHWRNKQQIPKYLTEKDKSDLLLSLIDFGVNLFVSTTSPLGMSAAAISLLSKTASDPAKSIPAIVVFHKIRVTNLTYSIFILTLINLAFCFMMFRKK